MARKFKSTITDWVAVEDDFVGQFNMYNAKNEYEGNISFLMVENSNDWVEIKQEPILVTEDGYDLYDKNEQIWFVFSGWPDDDFELDKRSINQTCNLEKQCVFYKKENAEAYIERHKPRYNIKDLMFLRQEVKNAFSWYWTEQEIKDAILKTIIHLKNSKND